MPVRHRAEHTAWVGWATYEAKLFVATSGQLVRVPERRPGPRSLLAVLRIPKRFDQPQLRLPACRQTGADPFPRRNGTLMTAEYLKMGGGGLRKVQSLRQR